jgi:hypothetical protein
VEFAGTNVTIAFNDATGVEDGVDFSGPSTSGINIYSNKLHGNRNSGAKMHGGTGCPLALNFYGNMLWSNDGDWGIIFQDTSNGLVANNTVIHFHDGSQNGLAPYGALQTQLANVPGTCIQTNNRYLNNILTANYSVGIAVHYTDSRAVFEANNVWNGNVLYQRGSQTHLIGFITDSANDVTTSNLATWQVSHPLDVTTAPAFVNAANCTGQTTTAACDASDFRLTGASTFKRAGATGALCVDVRGRPCWIPPDLGAYQTTSGGQASARSPITQPRAARQ